MSANPNLRALAEWEGPNGCLKCDEIAMYRNVESGEWRCNRCGYSFSGD